MLRIILFLALQQCIVSEDVNTIMHHFCKGIRENELEVFIHAKEEGVRQPIRFFVMEHIYNPTGYSYDPHQLRDLVLEQISTWTYSSSLKDVEVYEYPKKYYYEYHGFVVNAPEGYYASQYTRMSNIWTPVEISEETPVCEYIYEPDWYHHHGPHFKTRYVIPPKMILNRISNLKKNEYDVNEFYSSLYVGFIFAIFIKFLIIATKIINRNIQ